jgi:quaternary ammonium compound-resistance protein SugE
LLRYHYHLGLSDVFQGSVSMMWFYLSMAAACEMAWPVELKYTNGFKEHPLAIAGTFVVMGVSYWLLSCATNEGMPIGTAYAMWTGIGAAGTAIIGIGPAERQSNLERRPPSLAR